MILISPTFNKEKYDDKKEKEENEEDKKLHFTDNRNEEYQKKHVKITVIKETPLALNKKKTYLWNKQEQYYKQLSENTNNCEFFSKNPYSLL